jgi:hypothetical protein
MAQLIQLNQATIVLQPSALDAACLRYPGGRGFGFHRRDSKRMSHSRRTEFEVGFLSSNHIGLQIAGFKRHPRHRQGKRASASSIR